MAFSIVRSEPGQDLLDLTAQAVEAVDVLFSAARSSVRNLVATNGKIDLARLDQEQHAAHGLAWLKVYVEALREMRQWAERLKAENRCNDRESLILEIAFGEYLSRIEGGIAMSQGEIVRLRDLCPDHPAIAAFSAHPAVQQLIDSRGSTRTLRSFGRADCRG